ncbi:MAG: phosphatase PAP2 family protein [Mycoplasmoidaceae bacterium]
MNCKMILFNTKRSQLSPFVFLIVLGALLILFGIGAAFDLQIAKGIWEGLNHSEVLGRVVSGTLCNFAFFFIFTLVISFAICSFTYKNKKTWVPVLSCILAICVIALFSYFQYDDFFAEIKKANKILHPGSDTTICWVFMVLFWLINWIGSFFFSWYFICKRVNKYLMVRAGLFLIIGALLIMLGKEFWKILWSRPRPSSVMDDSILGLSFRPVWDIHPFECFDNSISKDIRDELKSFPSGHTSAAMLMVLSIVSLNSLEIFKTKKVKNIFMYLSFVFVILVAFNRMIARCHFLTDVTGAAILALIVSFFMPWCYKKENGNLLW